METVDSTWSSPAAAPSKSDDEEQQHFAHFAKNFDGSLDDDKPVVVEQETEKGSGAKGKWSKIWHRPTGTFTYPKLFDTQAKKMAWGILALAIVVTGVTVAAKSFQKVESTQYGLKYNVHSKVLDEAAQTGGLFTGPPGFTFIKFPRTIVKVDLPDGTCVSRDGLRVQFSVSFEYQMRPEWLKPAILKYRDFDKWATVVEFAGTSAVHHSCSKFDTSNFQNQRGIIQSTMLEALKVKLEGRNGDGASGIYASALSLQLSDVHLPEEYSKAVSEKQEAAEDILLAKKERPQELTLADTAFLSAEQEALKILAKAKNDANVTLTEASLKAEETKFTFETEAAVLLEVKSLLNLNTNGVLAYMTNRLYADVPNLKVLAGEPARLSRIGEL